MKLKGNILVLTYWSYSEALIQTYTLPYLEIMASLLDDDSRIYLVTLEKPGILISPKEKAQIETKLEVKKIRLIAFNYSPFGLETAFKWMGRFSKLLKLISTQKIKFIHCWCTPAGMIGFLLSKLTGRPLISDSFEPHAEAMTENGVWKKSSINFRLLFLFEKLQSKHSLFIIAAAPGMKEYSRVKYQVDLTHCYVKPACVNLELFSIKNRKKEILLQQFKLQNKIVCVYSGKFGGIYLDEEIFAFFKEAELFWGERFRALILTNEPVSRLKIWSEKSGLDWDKVIVRYVNHADIPDYIGLGDFAITPVKPVPTKKYCTPIKDGEYWALGLPVVITRDISNDSDIIRENKAGAVLNNLHKAAYREAIREIHSILSSDTMEGIYSKIRPLAIKYRSFELAEQIYRDIYLNAVPDAGITS